MQVVVLVRTVTAGTTANYVDSGLFTGSSLRPVGASAGMWLAECSAAQKLLLSSQNPPRSAVLALVRKLDKRTERLCRGRGLCEGLAQRDWVCRGRPCETLRR
jgi:hypothetical protein